MDHLKALVIKFVMILVVLGIILTGIYDGEFEDTLLISLVLTLVAYFLGDLMIFRKAGDDHDRNSDHVKRNIIATISDAVLAFVVIWLMGKSLFTDDGDVVTAALISALIIAAGEWFFHKYLDRHVFDEKHPAHTNANNH
jgi:amino acid transporter